MAKGTVIKSQVNLFVLWKFVGFDSCPALRFHFCIKQSNILVVVYYSQKLFRIIKECRYRDSAVHITEDHMLDLCCVIQSVCI